MEMLFVVMVLASMMLVRLPNDDAEQRNDRKATNFDTEEMYYGLYTPNSDDPSKPAFEINVGWGKTLSDWNKIKLEPWTNKVPKGTILTCEDGVMTRHKIVGKHSNYQIMSKSPWGTTMSISVHTLRQAKKWLECISVGVDYQEYLRAKKNSYQRAYYWRKKEEREYLEDDDDYEYTREERLADLKTQAMEMGFHNMWHDSDGNVCYGPSEMFPRYY